MYVIRRVSFPHLNVAFDEGGHKVGVMVEHFELTDFSRKKNRVSRA